VSAIREIFLNWFCGRRGYRVEIFNSNEHVCIFPELNIVESLKNLPVLA
jgi:hypothetical protein